MSKKDKKTRKKNKIKQMEKFDNNRQFIMNAMVENYDIMRKTTVSLCQQVVNVMNMFRNKNNDAIDALEILSETCSKILRGVEYEEKAIQDEKKGEELEVAEKNRGMENEIKKENV